MSDTIKKMETISVHEQKEEANKYDWMQAQLHLMCELAEGRKSGETEGWISSKDVRKHFRIRANAK